MANYYIYSKGVFVNRLASSELRGILCQVQCFHQAPTYDKYYLAERNHKLPLHRLSRFRCLFYNFDYTLHR